MKYVVFDIETTGLDTLNDSIIEIGAVKIIDNEVVEEFEELINPGFSIPDYITAINGIDNAMVRNADYPPNVLNRFHNFIKDCDFVIGHNAKSFDYPFLVSEFRKNSVKFDGVMCKDTMWIARAKLKRIRSYSLKSLCEHFGVVNTTAHRALSDVYATFEVYKHLQRY